MCLRMLSTPFCFIALLLASSSLAQSQAPPDSGDDVVMDPESGTHQPTHPNTQDLEPVFTAAIAIDPAKGAAAKADHDAGKYNIVRHVDNSVLGMHDWNTISLSWNYASDPFVLAAILLHEFTHVTNTTPPDNPTTPKGDDRVSDPCWPCTHMEMALESLALFQNRCDGAPPDTDTCTAAKAACYTKCVVQEKHRDCMSQVTPPDGGGVPPCARNTNEEEDDDIPSDVETLLPDDVCSTTCPEATCKCK